MGIRIRRIHFPFVEKNHPALFDAVNKINSALEKSSELKFSDKQREYVCGLVLEVLVKSGGDDSILAQEEADDILNVLKHKYDRE
jgi:hypothetical protein